MPHYIIGVDCTTRHYYRVQAPHAKAAEEAFKAFVEGTEPRDGGMFPRAKNQPVTIAFYDAAGCFYEPSSVGEAEESEWDKA